MREFEYSPGATPLTPEESEGLLLDHIGTRRELDEAENENIVRGVAWAESVRNARVTESFLKVLHKRMFDRVWAWAGEYRKTDKNIGVPWYEVSSRVMQLCNDTAFWIANESFDPREIGARFHHKLVWIHPFPNGNGRHARLATDLLMARALGSSPFSWGSIDLAYPSEVRQRYIAALQAADDHNFEPLFAFVDS